MENPGRLLRLSQIIKTPSSEDGFEPLVPVGHSAWWTGVKKGPLPAGDQARRLDVLARGPTCAG